MKIQDTYIGIDKDSLGGMTETGRIIRDAWAFGLIPDDETCAGWSVQRIEALWEKVQGQWKRHGFSVRNLPEDIREKYLAIQASAAGKARTLGWDPDADMEDEI